MNAPLPRFGRVEWLLIGASLFMASAFYVLRSSARESYYRFVREDGVAETFQALCILAASIVAAETARRLFKKQQKILGLGLGLFSALTFVVFCEEISWGQRIFGWQSPEYFQDANIQKETNLHNDVFFKSITHPALIAVGFYATFSPLLHAFLFRRRRFTAAFFTTEIPLVGFFAVFTVVYVVYQYLNPIIAPYYNGFDVFLWQDLEMAETFFYAGVLGSLVLKLRATRHFDSIPAAAPSAATHVPVSNVHA